MQKGSCYLHLDERCFDQIALDKLAKFFDSIHIGLLKDDCPVMVVDMQGWSRAKLKAFNRKIHKTLGTSPYIIKNALDNKPPNLRPYAWYTQEDCLNAALMMSHDEAVLSNHNYLYHFVNSDAISAIESIIGKTISQVRSIENSGSFIYPPDDGMMSWHTNESASAAPVRVYFVYSPQDRQSYFRYIDVDGRVYTSWDKKGWNIRAFHCGNLQLDGFRLWHCVLSNTHRFSSGFRLTGISLQDLESMAKECDSNYMNIENWRAW
ncbi:hypothetical protein GCM10007938_03250 [Vibrio zhanjiangensis]|uniref:Uncharacterized protein n=1 Tax=Vibrio zhanjiangensis TaxID=1046128 RepID=A0ABQ6EUQ4_9VIBR|nr:hypothetical protein [Vibrio zhanjiangensis]GLT16549.1 hypothetical protein GCM10007938_03250 [Vibrio zhanjiangensis]